jgi:hypothetical protein
VHQKRKDRNTDQEGEKLQKANKKNSPDQNNKRNQKNLQKERRKRMKLALQQHFSPHLEEPNPFLRETS